MFWCSLQIKSPWTCGGKTKGSSKSCSCHLYKFEHLIFASNTFKCSIVEYIVYCFIFNLFERITIDLNLCKHNSVQKIKSQEQLKIIYIMSNSMNLNLKNLENNYSFASFKQNMKKRMHFQVWMRKSIWHEQVYGNVLTNFMTTQKSDKLVKDLVCDHTWKS